MAVQYPDTIEITLAVAPVKDAAGDLAFPQGEKITSRCRGERQQGALVTDASGAQVVYRWKVYLPPLGAIVPAGSVGKLTLAKGGEYTAQIWEADNGQFNTRLCL